MLDKTTVTIKPTPPKIIVIKESPLKSLLVDSTTYVLVVAVIGTGWFLGSAAMQWAGFVILAVGALAVMAGKADKSMTIAEARKFLDKLEEEDAAR